MRHKTSQLNGGGGLVSHCSKAGQEPSRAKSKNESCSSARICAPPPSPPPPPPAGLWGGLSEMPANPTSRRLKLHTTRWVGAAGCRRTACFAAGCTSLQEHKQRHQSLEQRQQKRNERQCVSVPDLEQAAQQRGRVDRQPRDLLRSLGRASVGGGGGGQPSGQPSRR